MRGLSTCLTSFLLAGCTIVMQKAGPTSPTGAAGPSTAAASPSVGSTSGDTAQGSDQPSAPREGMFEMPNVIGMSVPDATARLRREGFERIDSAEATCSEDTDDGIVCDQSPEGGRTTSVNIPPNLKYQRTRLPKLISVVGLSVDEARAKIVAAGYAGIEVRYLANDREGCTKGKVCAMNPEAGVRLPFTRTVTLWFPPEEEPTVPATDAKPDPDSGASGEGKKPDEPKPPGSIF